MTLSLTDGSQMTIEVTRLNRGKVERIAKLFGGAGLTPARAANVRVRGVPLGTAAL